MKIICLMLSAALGCAAMSPALAETAPELTRFDLDGTWQVSVSGSNDWFAATVPGCVHTDLLQAKRIPDPFFRDNEKKVQWVGDQAWTYRRTFEVTEALLKREHLLLRCEGLDTLATILINGVQLGETDNMYRTWEFDVKNRLKPGANTIEIHFAPVLPFIRAKEAQKPLPTWQYPGAGYIRKMPCNFGWDWGPTLITCGIWKPISLVAYDAARLGSVLILQDHSEPDKVKLTIQVAADTTAQSAMSARVVVTTPDGKVLKPVASPLGNGSATAELAIARPKLWWPAGMGAQPLYTVKVELLDANGRLLDATQKRIGLRTMQVAQQTDAVPMHFIVNGRPFFVKGANWIPADAFQNRVSQARLHHYIADAAAANMNALRFWGGSYYEEDALFDACDELGICVWLDFKFACSTYPAFDPHFLENVRLEAVDQVKRLRHHPSIGVWCGNNEIMFFRGDNEWTTNKMSAPDYYKLFRDTLGGVMKTLAPQSEYVTGSPDCGDVHYWEVWHGGKPFEAYRDIHGFVSEFGFQSFPVPATINAFTAPEDRTSVYSPMIKHHERSNRASVDTEEDGTIGTDKIMTIVRMNFHAPKDFESTLWLSQINQAYGIEFAAEGWRREMPRSMGCVYWQYNDNWPGSSWSSVDYFGRWKALQYRARHFYSPVLVSADFNATNNVLALWLTSDELKPVAGKLSWRVSDLAGKEVRAGSQSVSVDAQTSLQMGELDLADLVQTHGANNLLVWLSLEVKGKTISQNTVLLAKPIQLELLDPKLAAEVSGAGTEYTISVRAQHPALWVWLDIGGGSVHFSDNFVHLAPGATQRFSVKLDQPMAKRDFVSALKIHSLYDTYSGHTQ